MSTVKIYKVTIVKGYQMAEQGTHYSLSPWGGDTINYEGYDNGGKNYILPEGFKIKKGNDGQEHIYNAKDQYCALFSKNGHPAIMNDNEIILKKA